MTQDQPSASAATPGHTCKVEGCDAPFAYDHRCERHAQEYIDRWEDENPEPVDQYTLDSTRAVVSHVRPDEDFGTGLSAAERCVVCYLSLPAGYGGLCEKHLYDEQRPPFNTGDMDLPDDVYAALEPLDKTQFQAEAEVRWYEANRCECGGSPITLDPGSQRHLATCTAILDFFKRHNRYPWEDVT